jgi:hypothetical protein
MLIEMIASSYISFYSLVCRRMCILVGKYCEQFEDNDVCDPDDADSFCVNEGTCNPDYPYVASRYGFWYSRITRS